MKSEKLHHCVFTKNCHITENVIHKNELYVLIDGREGIVDTDHDTRNFIINYSNDIGDNDIVLSTEGAKILKNMLYYVNTFETPQKNNNITVDYKENYGFVICLNRGSSNEIKWYCSFTQYENLKNTIKMLDDIEYTKLNDIISLRNSVKEDFSIFGESLETGEKVVSLANPNCHRVSTPCFKIENAFDMYKNIGKAIYTTQEPENIIFCPNTTENVCSTCSNHHVDIEFVEHYQTSDGEERKLAGHPYCKGCVEIILKGIEKIDDEEVSTKILVHKI